MRKQVLPLLSFGDIDELRREQALAMSKRVADERWRPPRRTKRMRPGEEPSAYQEEALLLYMRTRGG